MCSTLGQSLCVCSSDAAGILKQKLQGPQQVQTVHKGPSSAQHGQARVNLEVEPQNIEECMDSFLSVTEEFGHLFHQVWQVLNESDLDVVHKVCSALLALLVYPSLPERFILALFIHQMRSLPCCFLHHWGMPCASVLYRHPFPSCL